MDERIEFSNYLDDDVLGMSKSEWRDKLKADTATFVANGGEIEQIPYNWAVEIAARVGYWQSLGQTDLDEMLDSVSEETNVY